MFDYQSERHCSKTRRTGRPEGLPFDYQSERHCSKTRHALDIQLFWFDYQSERHCSKTVRRCRRSIRSLITSQNDTAPKQEFGFRNPIIGLITSQNDTAPKLSTHLREPRLWFDYQSERHCSKTIGSKSPLQGTLVLTDSVSSILKKLQVNRSFALVFILHLIMPVFKKENSQFREKSVPIEL